MDGSATPLTPDLPAAPAMLARFLTRFDAYCAASELPPGRVSRALFRDQSRVDDIRSTQSDVGVKRLAQADSELSRLAAEAGITLPDPVDSAESETGAARPLQAGAA